MGEVNTPKIKICGITTMKEADWLNEAGVDYAGFVFYEKSKRNVSLSDAVMIKKSLYPHTRTVAVTVSPTVDKLRQIEIAGFDIIQVHNELGLDVLEECKIPIWRAFNIAKLDGAAFDAQESPEGKKRRELLEDERIEAYVLDGVNFGGGVAFDWKAGNVDAIRQLFGTKKLVLAGGLNPENVAEGIRIFSPDIVDVSSGVEREFGGKDQEKIRNFVNQVRREKHE
jgi:phosphoribosylanthranilate isomerase